MKVVSVHVINLIFLGLIGVLGTAMFINISEPDPSLPAVNPIDIGIIITILVIWGINYKYQLKDIKWSKVLLANLTFIVSVSILILLVMPLLYDIFYI